MPMQPRPGDWAFYESGIPPWAEEYIEWLCTPRDKRVPPTQREFAEERKMSVPTLVQARKDERFQRQLEKRYAELNIRPDRLQEVVDAMWEKAKKGDTQAAKLYLDYVKMLKPPVPIVNVERGLGEMSDAELEREWERLRADRA